MFFVFWYVGVLYAAYFLVLYVFDTFGSGLGFKLHGIFVVYFLCESFAGRSMRAQNTRIRRILNIVLKHQHEKYQYPLQNYKLVFVLKCGLCDIADFCHHNPAP